MNNQHKDLKNRLYGSWVGTDREGGWKKLKKNRERELVSALS